MSHRLLLIGASLLMLAPVALADVLVLTNGDRIEGQVVAETDREVSIRRRFRDGGILYVQNFPRAGVLRIERGPADSQPAVLATLPADTSWHGSAETGDIKPSREDIVEMWQKGQRMPPEIKDPRRFLLNTIQKWEQGQHFAAAAELTRLLTSVKASELDAISPECENRFQMSLAAWAAHVHWTVCKARSKSGPLRLLGVTAYELPALVPMIVEAYEHAVCDEIHAPEPVSQPAARGRGRPAATRAQQRAATTLPADLGTTPTDEPELASPAPPPLTVLAWLDRPNELNVSRTQAAALSERIVYANSLVNERLRLDPAVRRDRSLQDALIGQRIRLIALLRAASDRASGHARADERSRKRDRRQKEAARRAEYAAEMQRLEHQQRQSLLHKALRLAQEQALSDVAGAQGVASPAPNAPPNQNEPAQPQPAPSN